MSKKQTTKKHIIKKEAHKGRRADRLLERNNKARFLILMCPHELKEMIGFSEKASIVNETAISKKRIDGFQYHAAKPDGYKELLFLTEQELRLFACSIAYARYHYCATGFQEGRFEELETYLGKRQVKSIKNKVGNIEWDKEEIGENDGWNEEE
jgi:hypothetical protein